MSDKSKPKVSMPPLLRDLRELAHKQRSLVRSLTGRDDKAGLDKLAEALRETKSLGRSLPVPPPPRIDFDFGPPPIPDFDDWIPDIPWPPRRPLDWPRRPPVAKYCDYQDHRTVNPTGSWTDLAAFDAYADMRPPKSAVLIASSVDLGPSGQSVVTDYASVIGAYTSVIDVPAAGAETEVSVTSRINFSLTYAFAAQRWPGDVPAAYTASAYLVVTHGATQIWRGRTLLQRRVADNQISISFFGPTVGAELMASVSVPAGPASQVGVSEWLMFEVEGNATIAGSATWDPLDAWLSRGCRLIRLPSPFMESARRP